MGEFELIARFFDRPLPSGSGVALGVGDDCALIEPTPGQRLAVSSDMLVEGRHFLSTVDPAALGHKALAVNLSDLAACGARPRAFTLALSLPRPDEAWLGALATGLHALGERHRCPLVGGDTTAGPLNLCITVLGEVPPGQALLRSAAQPGDDLWVSGTLGGARLALEVFRGRVPAAAVDFDSARRAMEWPEPRVALGLALRGVAHAAIDVSDGALGDLGHILRASRLDAEVWADALPAHPALATRPLDERRRLMLAGGDDYELLFTAPPSRRDAVLAAAACSHTPVHRIGRLHPCPQGVQPGPARVLDAQGRGLAGPFASFDHFKAEPAADA